MNKLKTSLGVLACSAALAIVLGLAAFKVRAGKLAEPVPVKVFGAVGCQGTYVVWVLLSNGAIILRDESSGATIRQLAELLKEVPAQVRHFDNMCPLVA